MHTCRVVVESRTLPRVHVGTATYHTRLTQFHEYTSLTHERMPCEYTHMWQYERYAPDAPAKRRSSTDSSSTAQLRPALRPNQVSAQFSQLHFQEEVQDYNFKHGGSWVLQHGCSLPPSSVHPHYTAALAVLSLHESPLAILTLPPDCHLSPLAILTLPPDCHLSPCNTALAALAMLLPPRLSLLAILALLPAIACNAAAAVSYG
jgi:hypothetical protein